MEAPGTLFTISTTSSFSLVVIKPSTIGAADKKPEYPIVRRIATIKNFKYGFIYGYSFLIALVPPLLIVNLQFHNIYCMTLIILYEFPCQPLHPHLVLLFCPHS